MPSQIIIPKGENYSHGMPSRLLFRPTVMKIHVRMNRSIIEQLPHPDYLDWNKLTGFSRGFHSVNQVPEGLIRFVNSYRIAWRFIPHTDMLEFAPYQYDKGEKTAVDYPVPSWQVQPSLLLQKKWDVSTEVFEHRFEIWLGESVAIYTSQENTVTLRVCGAHPFWGYVCKPYHGGNLPAQHEIRMELGVEVGG